MIFTEISIVTENLSDIFLCLHLFCFSTGITNQVVTVLKVARLRIHLDSSKVQKKLTKYISTGKGFIGTSHNSMCYLESCVHDLELSLEEILLDLAPSAGRISGLNIMYAGLDIIVGIPWT
nr:PREDICTED: uncharacterized protein LOC108220905 isoform X1 [Daucus carota subsp. sativus]